MKNFFFRQQTSILSAAFVLALAILMAKFLGIIRYWLLTIYVHPISDLDVFFAAFRLPDLIFQILVMGALTSAFIPTITDLLSKNLHEKAWRTASTVINLSLGAFLILAILMYLGSSQLAVLVAPGFSGFPEKISTLSDLTKIMLIAQLFFVLSNFSSAIIQSTKRFLIPALAPIAYNLGIIIGIVFFYPLWGLYGLAWGVVVGTILHFAIQIPLIRHLNFTYQPHADINDPHAREIGRLLLPRTLGLAVSQISFTVDTALASLLSTSSITILNLSSALQQLPVGLFGATIAQAALPTLSEEQSQQGLEKFKTTLANSFNQILFFTLPATAILIVLRIPIVRLAFGLGNTNLPWPTTVLTGQTLAFFAIGIFAQSQINLLARAFYALKDSVTPVKVGVLAFAVNIVLSLILVTVFNLPIWALAASSVAGDLINFSLLFLVFHKRLQFDLRVIIIPALKIFSAAIITGLSLYFPLKLLDQLVFDTTKTIPLIVLSGSVSTVGLGVYIFFSWLFDVKELNSLFGLIGRIKHIGRIESTPTEVIETVESHG